ncbi:MAG: hypothetical protein ACKVS9_13745 [Phycisphaerae bacterium]
MSWARFIIGSIVAVLLAAGFAVQFGSWQVARLTARVDELEREKKQLVAYAERLSASRRVAQVDVLRQAPDETGTPVTTLQWQEIGADGVRGIVKEISVRGEQVYFEAMVLKFEHRLVAESGDTDRPVVSLALFRRIFGDRQPPESGIAIDRGARPTTTPTATADEQAKLWSRFWELADAPREAAKYGIRIAQLEAPSARMRPGEIWEVTLDNAGGVNLKKLGVR